MSETQINGQLKIKDIHITCGLSLDVLNSLPQGVALHLESHIFFLNERAKKILGIQTFEELTGKTILDFISDDYHRIVKLYLNKIKRSPGFTTDTATMKFKNTRGILIDVETNTSSLIFENNFIFVTSFTNQRKQKQINSEINRFSMALNHNPASILLTDKAGKIEFVNPTFLEETGFHVNEVLGKTPRILKSGLMPDQNYANLWKTILSGKRWMGEMHNRKKNGEFYWEKTSISPIVDDTGNITNFVAIKENITERKKMERLKEDTEQLLRHDLKNMLNGIMGLSRLLMISNNIPQTDLKKWSTAMYQSGKKILSAINNSFDIYKMETGTYIRKTDQVNLIQVMQEIYLEYKGILDSLSLQLKFDINGNTEDWNETVIIYGDESHIKTLFMNLIQNAAEASPENKDIHVRISTKSNYCETIIHNEGAVPESIRNNFFDRYSTAGKKGGTGIGTYSAFIFARAHGGNITFTSSEQEGTSVTVILPLEFH